MPGKSRRDPVFLVFLLCAGVFWGLAIAGAIRAYSPVPFWDMWDGYLGFFVKVSSGDWSAWWAQHNEHRILLARILFWIDLAWFEGAGWFLLVANYVFLSLVGVVFWIALREHCSKDYRFLGLFLLVWLSSWSQNNNLTWGFQSQFILAQLLPLLAFFMLHRAVSDAESSRGNFVAACCFGVLSLGSMANGVLALPLMTAYAAITRLGWKRVAILAGLSGLGLGAYFYNYHAPAGHGSLLVALKENPVGLVNYVLLYVGGPFFYILRKGEIAAQLAGAVLIASSAYLAWQSLRKVSQFTLELALLTFILYVGGTALGTAGGRLFFGVEQALSSRYMTPALMAWAAWFVILSPKIICLIRHRRGRLWIPLFALTLVMLPVQLKALKPKTTESFERSVAALALEMRIKDQAQIGHVFPSADWALSLSEVPSAKNISVFGHPLFRDVREQIGLPLAKHANTDRVCQGSVDGIEPIEDDPRYMRIRGWLFDQERKAVPRSLWIVKADSIVVGHVLLGESRPDVAASIDPAAVNSGFRGYFLADAQGGSVKLLDPESKCSLPVMLPVSFFRMSSGMKLEHVTVSSRAVSRGNQWTGSDFQGSRFNGYVVMGSFRKSDADTGSISLHLKRGDRLLFRSGPTGGKQYIRLNNEENSKVVLPVALNWRILEFSSPILPDEFPVTLSDEGAGWGEWSAIALIAG